MALKEITFEGNKYPIHYDILNPKAEKDFIVLHGWGSNKEIMKGAFAKTLPGFRHIYIDMPGFGKSSNETVLNTQKYAQIIALFLEALNAKKEIVAGHSFGGKVATLLEPDLLVLLSSSGVLVPKPWQVKAKIALYKALKPFGFSALRRFFASDDVKEMNPAMYETFKNVVDEDFTPVFAKHEKPALLFWGKEDTATPLWTAEKIQTLMKSAKLYPMEGDHYFFTRHSETIAKIINEEYHANII